jgi:hypothetical protein
MIRWASNSQQKIECSEAKKYVWVFKFNINISILTYFGRIDHFSSLLSPSLFSMSPLHLTTPFLSLLQLTFPPLTHQTDNAGVTLSLQEPYSEQRTHSHHHYHTRTTTHSSE